jgi:hypothetical protein
MDELIRLWAWWLLKWYDFEGYPEPIYEGYTYDYVDPWEEADLEMYGGPEDHGHAYTH